MNFGTGYILGFLHKEILDSNNPSASSAPIKDRREDSAELLKRIKKIFKKNNNYPLSLEEIKEKLSYQDIRFLTAVLVKGVSTGELFKHPEAKKYCLYSYKK